jgi:sec-independent protein translocase protein TatA
MLPCAFLGNMNPLEILLIFGIIVLLFGSSKIPALARSLGKSLGEFKKGREEGNKLASEEIKDVVDELKKEDPKKVEEAKKA